VGWWQKKFTGFFLKGENNGWDEEARVLLYIRHPGERFKLRAGAPLALAITPWTKLALDACQLSPVWNEVPSEGSISFDALSEGVTLHTVPLEAETEITSPFVAKQFVASSTTDADIIATRRPFDAAGEEIPF
jgi:hypothetical protein